MKPLYAQGKVSEAIGVALYFSCQLGLPAVQRKRVSMLNYFERKHTSDEIAQENECRRYITPARA